MIKKGKPLRQLSLSHRALLNAANVTPASCFDISRDSQLSAVASGRTVQIWQINVPQLTQTFEGHTGAVTCVSFSPNSEFVVSGSEDKTVIVWGLVLGLVVTTFKGHAAPVSCVVVMMDSRRTISADRDGLLCVWLADSATLLQTIQGPHKSLAATNNMKFAVSTIISVSYYYYYYQISTSYGGGANNSTLESTHTTSLAAWMHMSAWKFARIIIS